MLTRFLLFLLTTTVAFSALPPVLRNSATTNAVPRISTGAGITNTAGVYYANLAEGANITLTTGANGQISIAGSAGGSAPVGTVVSNGTAVIDLEIPLYAGTSGTNLGPSGIVSTGSGSVASLIVDGALSAESLSVTGSGVGLMLLGDTDGDHYGGVAPNGTTTTDTILNLPAAPVAGYMTATIDAVTNMVLSATTMITLSQSDDPDVSAAGQLTWDTDGWLRAYDGAAQVAVGRKQEEIHATVIAPNDLADAVRDGCLIWSNESGMSFIVTGWKAWSGTDDTTLNIETTAADGQTNATVDAVEVATDGTGVFTGADTSITAGTIANGSLIWLDFDDTDTPTYVKIVLYGYYAADVN